MRDAVILLALEPHLNAGHDVAGEAGCGPPEEIRIESERNPML